MTIPLTQIDTLFINGAKVAPEAGTEAVINPATEAVIGQAPVASLTQVDAAIAAARESDFLKDALGPEMHRTFTEVKAAEYQRVARTISDVDYDLYLHTV